MNHRKRVALLTVYGLLAGLFFTSSTCLAKEVSDCRFYLFEQYINTRCQMVAPPIGDYKKVEAAGDDRKNDFYPRGIAKEDGTGRLLFCEPETVINHVPFTHFSEGLASVIIEDDRNPIHCAFIDETKHVVLNLPAQILDAGDFHDGLAPISYDRGRGRYRLPYLGDNKVAFINRSGHLAFPPIVTADKIKNLGFVDGTACINLDGYTCYIDRRGKVRARFVSGGNFQNGIAAVSVFLDKKGNALSADPSKGYLTEPALRYAWLHLLERRLSKIDEPLSLEFVLKVDQDDHVDCQIQKSSGDQKFDSKMQDILTAVKPPRRGPTLASGCTLRALSFQNGKLSLAKAPLMNLTKPILPEGAPIPDNE